MTPCGTVHVVEPDRKRWTMYVVPLAPIVPLPRNDVRPLMADVTEMVVEPRVLALPAASVKLPAATRIVAVPGAVLVPVKVAV